MKRRGGMAVPKNLWIPITTSKEERRVGASCGPPLLGETSSTLITYLEIEVKTINVTKSNWNSYIWLNWTSFCYIHIHSWSKTGLAEWKTKRLSHWSPGDGIRQTRQLLARGWFQLGEGMFSWWSRDGCEVCGGVGVWRGGGNGVPAKVKEVGGGGNPPEKKGWFSPLIPVSF